MEIEKAIERAEKNEEIKSIIESEGFLVSGYIILDCSESREKITSWNLNYYNPENGNITHIEITKDKEEVGEEDEPLKDKDYKEFENHVKISAEKAIEIAEKKIGNIICTKVIVSLQKDEDKEYWSIAFIKNTGSVSAVHVDIESGKIIFSEETNLLENVQKSIAS